MRDKFSGFAGGRVNFVCQCLHTVYTAYPGWIAPTRIKQAVGKLSRLALFIFDYLVQLFDSGFRGIVVRRGAEGGVLRFGTGTSKTAHSKIFFITGSVSGWFLITSPILVFLLSLARLPYLSLSKTWRCTVKLGLRNF